MPFMTPIVEKTESSIAVATARSQREYFAAKTPSRSRGAPAILEDGEPWSSPFHDIGKDIGEPMELPQLALRETKKPVATLVPKPQETKQKGPIIKDVQCNPVDEGIRDIILSQIQPPLSSYEGYFADNDRTYGKGAEIRKWELHNK